MRIPDGRARLLMVTVGAPSDGFANAVSALLQREGYAAAGLAEAAGRFGVTLGWQSRTGPEADSAHPPASAPFRLECQRWSSAALRERPEGEARCSVIAQNGSMNADEVMRQYADAWSRGEPEMAFAFYANDVVMHLPGRGRLAGVHQGKAAVVATIRELVARTDGDGVSVEVLDRLTSESGVALVLREVVKRGEETLDIRRVNVYRVRDGEIVDIQIFEANQYDVDEFFG